MKIHLAFIFVSAALFSQNISSRPATPQHISEKTLATHSERYEEYASGHTAEQIIASGQHYDAALNTFVVAFHPPDETAFLQPLRHPLDAFTTLSLNSDAIVIATPLKRASALTASHTFVFSDYEASVDSVYKDENRSIAPGTTIVISRPGGEVRIGNANFRAIETEFPLFQIGESYLFFLHLIPETGFYKVNPSEAYLLKDDRIESGQKHARVNLTETTRGDVLKVVQQTMAQAMAGNN